MTEKMSPPDWQSDDFSTGDDDIPPGNSPFVRRDCGVDFYAWQGLWWVWDVLPDEGKRWHQWHRDPLHNAV